MTERADKTSTDPVCPSRNDYVTTSQAICQLCGTTFHPRGRRRFCSDACRQAAWRARHRVQKEPASLQTREVWLGRSTTVYECPSCSTRYLGEQRCPECQLFCRRIGPGGRCPHCEEPVALADLVGN